jgi:hypothetical protein
MLQRTITKAAVSRAPYRRANREGKTTMKNRAGSVSKYTTKGGERLRRYRFDSDPVDGKRCVISGKELHKLSIENLSIRFEVS